MNPFADDDSVNTSVSASSASGQVGSQDSVSTDWTGHTNKSKSKSKSKPLKPQKPAKFSKKLPDSDSATDHDPPPGPIPIPIADTINSREETVDTSGEVSLVQDNCDLVVGSSSTQEDDIISMDSKRSFDPFDAFNGLDDQLFPELTMAEVPPTAQEQQQSKKQLEQEQTPSERLACDTGSSVDHLLFLTLQKDDQTQQSQQHPDDFTFHDNTFDAIAMDSSDLFNLEPSVSTKSEPVTIIDPQKEIVSLTPPWNVVNDQQTVNKDDSVGDCEEVIETQLLENNNPFNSTQNSIREDCVVDESQSSQLNITELSAYENIPVRKIPIPLKTKKVASIGPPTVPKVSAVAFKPHAPRQSPLICDVASERAERRRGDSVRAKLRDDSISIDEPVRPKSVNILQSAFMDNADVSRIQNRKTISLTTHVVKSRGSVRNNTGSTGGFSKPRTVTHDPRKDIDGDDMTCHSAETYDSSQEVIAGDKSGHFSVSKPVIPLPAQIEVIQSTSGRDQLNDIPRIEQRLSTVSAEDSTQAKIKNQNSFSSRTSSGNSLTDSVKNKQSTSYVLVRGVSTKKETFESERLQQLMMMNAVDDLRYDIENEYLDAAACRPVSQNYNVGLFRSTEIDTNPFNYASDSTDTDDSDDWTIASGCLSDVDEIGTGAGISMGDIESSGNVDRERCSSKKTPSENRKAPLKRKVYKKKTKKEKIAKRNLKRTQKAPTNSSPSVPMTEREKSVARYRATLERIDRKLRKEGFGEEIKCVDENDENATIRFLLSGRVFGYPRTDGSISSNYIAFLKQKHPFLSLFWHHPLHPLKTPRRLVVFICVLFFAFIMSVILLEGFYFNEEFICAGGCNRQSPGNSSDWSHLHHLNSRYQFADSPEDDTMLLFSERGASNVENTIMGWSEIKMVLDDRDNGPSSFNINFADNLLSGILDDRVENYETNDGATSEPTCIGGPNDGMKYDKYKRSCEYYPPWAIGFIAGALIGPYDLLLKFLSTCGCVQGRTFFQNNCCGVRCKGFIVDSGNKIFVFFIIMNILFTLAALYRAYFVLNLPTVLATFVVSEIMSFGYWIAWTIPYFSFKFPSDRKIFYKNLRKERKKEWKRNNPGRRMPSQDEMDDAESVMV